MAAMSPKFLFAGWALFGLLAGACSGERERGPAPLPPRSAEDRRAERWLMVEQQIRARGVRDEAVLEAMRRVPRHRFVPEGVAGSAYRDHPLPIGHGQTISQPYIVAFMTEAAEIRPGDRVLEVGTGSGYQAAVLAEMGAEVTSIEILRPLAERARAALATCGYDEVRVIVGDGYRGCPEAAPFDAIVVTAAPTEIPEPLLEQLAVGGRLVIPVGEREQYLVRVRRTAEGFERERLVGVRFVPMTGEAQWER